VKTLVNAMSAAVERFPWVVIAVVLVISFALGSGASQFQPAEDQNEAFAPDAPELVATETISDQYGADSSASVMQIVVASESGDVITLDGLAASQSLEQTIRSGALGPFLVDETGNQPAVLSWMAPVGFALQEGAPVPTSDAEVKAVYSSSLQQLPPDQVGFITGLLPGSADQETVSSPSALMLTFSVGPASTDEFDAFVETTGEAADESRNAPLPDGYAAEPFAFELLFEGQDEFEAEIGRLFATAAFIILLVLSLVFMLRPQRPRDRWLKWIGFAVMAAAVTLLVLPGLALLFPDSLPESWGDADTGPLLGIAALTYLVVFAVWTFTSRPLRRTTANTIVTIFTILLAITWMNGYGYLRFGEASPMAQILPILLIGLGVDYSIHMNTRYQEEVSGGATVRRAVSTSIRTVGIALVLATITTAVGFLTNVVNEIPALREFGELAAFGIVASFVLMLTFVPSIRLLLDRRGEERDTLDPEMLRGGSNRALPRFIGSFAVLPRRFAVATVIVSILLAILGAYGVTQLSFKFSFLDFVPTTSPVRGTFQTLLDDYGGGFGETTQVLIEGDVATAEAYNSFVAATNNMADTPNVLQFGGLPAAQSPVSVVIGLASPESAEFSPEFAQLAGSMGMTAENPAVAPESDVVVLYDGMFAAAPDQAGEVLAADNGAYISALFTIQTQAGEGGANQLRDDLLEDFAPVTGVGLTVTTTSDEIINDVIITTLRDSQVSSLLLTLLAALILLVINFWVEVRRPVLGVITTLPVVLVVLLSFALMAAFGIAFGPVTATISALAIGIGIPYMIHITHRYEEDLAHNPDPDVAIGETLTHTGGALAGSAITTMAGFGILVTSTTIPFRQFGFVTAYTIGLALLAAVLVLPSYLYLWDQWHRRRGASAIDTEALHQALQDEEPPDA
jgi:predicted RND superfamily exporter protein